MRISQMQITGLNSSILQRPFTKLIRVRTDRSNIYGNCTNFLRLNFLIDTYFLTNKKKITQLLHTSCLNTITLLLLENEIKKSDSPPDKFCYISKLITIFFFILYATASSKRALIRRQEALKIVQFAN